MPYDFSQYVAMLNPAALQQQQQEQAFAGTPSPLLKPVRTMVNVVPPGEQSANQAAPPAQPPGILPASAPAPHHGGGMSAYAPETSDEQQMKDQFLKAMADRQGALGQEQKQLADEKAKAEGMKGNLAYADLSGLNQFADAMTGSHLSQSYKAPTDEKDTEAMVQKLGESVRKNADGISGDQLQFLKDQATLRNNKALIGKMGSMDKLDQADERIHNNNVREMVKDPILNPLITSTQNLQNGIQNFQKGGTTPQEFMELQQAVRSNIGTKGVGGANERGETYINSLPISVTKLKQFLSGDPQSVMESDPAFANQILSLARMELQNKQRQANARVEQLKIAHASFYGRPGHEGLGNDYANAGRSAVGMFNSPDEIMGKGPAQDPLARMKELQAKKVAAAGGPSGVSGN